jgi:hypothetical protein
MALSTFSRVTWRTPGRWFSTRSTVARLTPAEAAISWTVGLITPPDETISAKFDVRKSKFATHRFFER